MDTASLHSLFKVLLGESRAIFSIEITRDFSITSVSQAYFKGIHDTSHNPTGLALSEIIAGNSRVFEDLGSVEGKTGAVVPVSFTIKPPFPAPRNVRGAAGILDDGFFLVLERDIGPIGIRDEKPAPLSLSPGMHADLLTAQYELSRLRRKLSMAEVSVSAFDAQKTMMKMIIPLLESIAERAKSLSSLAVIISTRLESSEVESRDLVRKLEHESIELFEAATRLMRGLG